MRDDGMVAVPEEFHTVFNHWCAARIPPERRDELQIAYTIQGDEVTIIERQPPAFPELGAAWTSTPLVQLRYGDPEPGLWSLYVPHDDDGWRRYEAVPPADDPEQVLNALQR